MFNFFSSKGYLIKFKYSDLDFVSEPGKTLLTSALNKGVKWPFKCRVGSCGTCKCKLLSGKVKKNLDFSYTLNQNEISENYILACQSIPRSDLLIQIEFDK